MAIGGVFWVAIRDTEAAQEKIAAIINEWNGSSRYTNEVDYGFDRYIEVNLRMYETIKLVS